MMHDILGRIGDVFYWVGCLAAIWASGVVVYITTVSRWSDDGFLSWGLVELHGPSDGQGDIF